MTIGKSQKCEIPHNNAEQREQICFIFLFTSIASMLILSLLTIVVSNEVYAADTFTIEAKIDLTKIVNPET
jgi:hypothetical protein